MPLDYYYTLHSAPCRGPMMTAKALGVELNLKPVDLWNKEQLKPEFVALNPQHTVPTLVDGDLVLWESKAISGYLVGQYGKDDSLYPVEPNKRALVDRMLYFDVGLHQRFRDYAHPVMRLGEAPNPEKLAALHEGIGYLDSQLKKQGTKFVTGDSVSVADHSLACAITTYRELGVPLTDHPAVEAWLKNCEQTMPGYEDICLKGAKMMAGHLKSKFHKK